MAIYVLDTNVLLHDPTAIQQFEDNDVVIPLRVIETRVLRGPNYWSHAPVVRMLVDLGVLEEFPSNTICPFPTDRARPSITEPVALSAVTIVRLGIVRSRQIFAIFGSPWMPNWAHLGTTTRVMRTSS